MKTGKKKKKMLYPITQFYRCGKDACNEISRLQSVVRLRLTKLEIPHDFGKKCIWCYYCNLMCDKIK